MVQSYGYDSFGRVTASGSVDQPYTYTGREYDAETGKYYYRLRYYDADSGRFLSRDPLSFAAGDVVLDNYVGGNPVNYVDPWGLVITPVGTPNEEKIIRKVLARLSKKSDNAKRMILALDASEVEIKIGIRLGEGSQYVPKAHVCFFNPKQKWMGDDGKFNNTVPAEIILAHELIHAYHDIGNMTGKTRMEEENNTVGLQGDSIFTENLIRKDYGIPRRDKY